MTLDMQQLHGHWRLVSFLEQRPNGEWFPFLGEGAKGYISYWPGGRMQVVMAAGDRPRLRGGWASIPADQKAVCLDRMVAYSGSFDVQADRVVHYVDVCWIPNWEGRELVRLVEMPDPDQLVLSTVPDPEGRRPVQRVFWERME